MIRKGRRVKLENRLNEHCPKHELKNKNNLEVENS